MRHERSPMQRDVVLQAQAGDHDAFSALAGGAISRLHRTARLILRDDDRASDAVQEALTTACPAISEFRARRASTGSDGVAT